MICCYRNLLILYFCLYFVFLLLPIWRIKPDDDYCKVINNLAQDSCH